MGTFSRPSPRHPPRHHSKQGFTCEHQEESVARTFSMIKITHSLVSSFRHRRQSN